MAWSYDYDRPDQRYEVFDTDSEMVVLDGFTTDEDFELTLETIVRDHNDAERLRAENERLKGALRFARGTLHILDREQPALRREVRRIDAVLGEGAEQ